MGAVLTSANCHRHVVFPAAPVRPLNVGAGLSVRRAPVCGTPEDLQPDDGPFLSWLFRQAGLRAIDYRTTSLQRRVPACLRALRVADAIQARRVLRRNPQLVPVALAALLLGVTGFFRDGNVFAIIAGKLRTRMRDIDRPLRVWSAGCSDGAELYSVAMILGEMNLLHRCELVGTDCREDAVTTAAAGRFEPSLLRGAPATLLLRYFDGSGRIVARVRERTRWRCANVLAEIEPGPWDIILCRNLAMYLQPHAAERLWRQLGSVLAPGGLLVVGRAERPRDAGCLAAVGQCVYRRQGDL